MVQPFSSSDLFVSTEGYDGWSGTLAMPNGAKTDGPLASVERARTMLRERKGRGLFAGPVTVWIRAGRYFLDRPLTFDTDDSGPVTYAAHPGEGPVFDAGTPISGWREEERDGRRLWTAAIGAVLRSRGYFRSLFVKLIGSLISRGRGGRIKKSSLHPLRFGLRVAVLLPCPAHLIDQNSC